MNCWCISSGITIIPLSWSSTFSRGRSSGRTGRKGPVRLWRNHSRLSLIKRFNSFMYSCKDYRKSRIYRHPFSCKGRESIRLSRKLVTLLIRLCRTSSRIAPKCTTYILYLFLLFTWLIQNIKIWKI